MKNFNLIIVIVLLLSFSCNKQNETPINPINNSESQGDFTESVGLIYFDIPQDYKASNNNVGNTELVTEIVNIQEQDVEVVIELIRSEDGMIISLGISQDFAELTEMNNITFLMNNESVFATYYESEARGWLGRFFIGVEKKTPCNFGTYMTYNDHWLVGDYGFSLPKPC